MSSSALLFSLVDWWLSGNAPLSVQPRGVFATMGEFLAEPMNCCCTCAAGQSRPIRAIVDHGCFFWKFCG